MGELRPAILPVPAGGVDALLASELAGRPPHPAGTAKWPALTLPLERSERRFPALTPRVSGVQLNYYQLRLVDG